MSEKWFVYIIECEDGSFCTGISQNVLHRFRHHRNSQGSLHTRSHKPVRIVWTEEYLGLQAARSREMQLKGWTRRKKTALITGDFERLRKL